MAYKHRRPSVYGLSVVIYKEYTTYRYVGIRFDLFRTYARFKFSTIYPAQRFLTDAKLQNITLCFALRERVRVYIFAFE